MVHGYEAYAVRDSRDRERRVREMNAKQNRRLRRSNAIKDIDYEESSSSFSSSFEDWSKRGTLVSDLVSNIDRTSFRIEGVDGEFDRICQTLGLSGPEDFAIPPAAWKASKARSSSDHSPSPRFQIYHRLWEKESAEKDLADGFEVKGSVNNGFSSETERSLSKFSLNSAGRDRKCDQVREADVQSIELNVVKNSRSVRSCKDGGNGIKGTRPPVLAPPPGMSPFARDNVSSTWDILKSFGPQDDEDLRPSARLGLISPSDEVDGVNRDDEELDAQIVGKQDVDTTWLKPNSVPSVSESCSDSSKDDNDENDDDSFNMTMEPVYYISPNRKFKRRILSWQRGDFLGSGSFGTVYEGFTDDGFFFAVKEVSLLDQGSQGKQSIYQLEQEISLLSQFEHENIVQYLGTDKDDSKLYIFLEFVTKGSLASLYQKYHLRDSQVSAYTRQILNGLDYLHQQDVIHRDIKCANILVDASGAVKLADFGLAKATKLNDIKSCKGTAFWMAPEVVNRKNRGYGLAADIWSLGCTVLEMLTRQIPYSHLEGMQALFRIGRGEPPLIPSSLSNDAQDFIHKCLQVNPDNRPAASQLLDHPFIKRSSSNLSSASPHYNRSRS